MKTYWGKRDAEVTLVMISDDAEEERRREGIPGFNGAASFDWGNHSRQAAHLARAILEDLRGRSFAVAWYLIFMSDVIAKLPRAGFTLSEAAIHSQLGRIMGGDEQVWEPVKELS